MSITFLFALALSLAMFSVIGLFFYKEIKHIKELEKLREENFQKQSKQAEQKQDAKDLDEKSF